MWCAQSLDGVQAYVSGRASEKDDAIYVGTHFKPGGNRLLRNIPPTHFNHSMMHMLWNEEYSPSALQSTGIFLGEVHAQQVSSSSPSGHAL